MLKLKRVQILGFKSFCDRTAVDLAGDGIVAVVGPNGCGKSNISDAITWVLGEQSAKSLRGVKMEDVIFAGTRDRKPTGMAEVSLTLVDPDLYDSERPAARDFSSVSAGPGAVESSAAVPGVVSIDGAGDWDEVALQRERAEETEEAVAEAQPGAVVNALAAADALAAAEDPDNRVQLKIRRRRFGHAPVRAGEVTITRRLFRTGDSEYLLNGKICRLRDIQEMFLGTGLGGESYAIIGQERIGQLLSSKPLDRRAIIEEAAGITRFKTKKRLAELRLESARQNLSRVNDIFDEVSKQMGTLKRQAAKAQRYGELAGELRTRLRVVLASRMAQLDSARAATADQIAALTAEVDARSRGIESMDAAHTEGVRRGYTLDAAIREANTAANASAVELEGIAARAAANVERVAELTERLARGAGDLDQARAQLAALAGELESHRSFAATANADSATSREEANRRQQEAQAAIRAVASAEHQVEQDRRAAMQLMQAAGQSRNEEMQAAAALSGLEAEADRLMRESANALAEMETLGLQRGQVKLTFEDAAGRLQSLESAIASLRDQLGDARGAETASKRKGDQLRGEVAMLAGRKKSLEALIEEHSYSTDTVRDLFRAARKRPAEAAPAGTLADFLEVDSRHETIVDEYLRDELNTIVLLSWNAATAHLQLLEREVAGRATFLVPGDVPPERDTHSTAAQPTAEDGAIPLREVVRITGHAPQIAAHLRKLTDGYLVPMAGAARDLAARYPDAYFLTLAGETFHGATVSGGRPSAQGPLALKRELHDIQRKFEAAKLELAETDRATAGLQHRIAQLTADLDAKTHERRDLERESANSSAALRQLDGEAERLSRRMQDGQLALGRNGDARKQKEDLIARRQGEAANFEARRTQAEAELADLQARLEGLRRVRDDLQQAAAVASAALASLEERRRNAAANLERTCRLADAQEARIAQLDQQQGAGATEKLRREEETVALSGQHAALAGTRAAAVADAERLNTEAVVLRDEMAALDVRLRALRHETEALRERRATLSAQAAKLAADLEHLEQTCADDLGAAAAELRADAAIQRIEGETLVSEEAEARTLKQKLEAIGPVNMMALEEYAEAAGRHAFLETQRQDLYDSISHTMASIREIDDVSRTQFDDAFKAINRNFATTFTKLFGGGQASMKLTDSEHSAESGIDILASPPGKKLQNILLLSGGEKALTALSLLVGIFQFQPAPFCILDEVDAPLDDTNVGRFAKLIDEMSASTQFVVITHSKRTMQEADVIYGVTMQEPGVSKIVSVNVNRRDVGVARRASA